IIRIQVLRDALGKLDSNNSQGELYIGDVELTLGIIRIQFTKRVAQYLAIKSKNAGVNFVNGALRVVGIFVLNNRGDLARFVANDASISSRIRKLDAQHRNSIAVVDVGSTELIDGLRAQ